ncbi:MAG: DUF1326 domain-containing protein [Longimicrobiales bacterium]
MSDWQLNGNIIIACNCDFGCPCNFNARPSHGKCEGGWVWAIADGQVRGVRVAGLALALYADWPGAIHEGGGRAVSYLDDRANAQQQDALTRLVRGEFGGPWGIFINTYQLEGPAPARFDIQFAEYDTKLRIGDAVALELKKIRNPVTQAEVHPEMILPEGLVVKRGRLAASKVFQVRDGIRYDHSGQYAAFGPFTYTS